METKHISVLLQESINYLDFSQGKTFIDCTLGLGGHTQEILKRMSSDSVLIAIDRDPECIKHASVKFKNDIEKKRLLLFHEPFSHLDTVISKSGLSGIDGLLADLGVSSMQFDTASRGFSFQDEAPLDMRMNTNDTTAAKDILQTYTFEELSHLLKTLGDEREHRKIARAIVRERETGTLETTFDLNRVVQKAKKKQHNQKIHPSTKTFMALRMAVNNELQELKTMLGTAIEHLNPGGIMSIISFHSGEDRIVKNIFSTESRDCLCDKRMPQCTCGHTATLKILTNKPVLPSENETEHNPRARSAKLRVAKKL